MLMQYKLTRNKFISSKERTAFGNVCGGHASFSKEKLILKPLINKQYRNHVGVGFAETLIHI